jgi:hypothetical protein
MWASISFTLYASLYITIILMQLNVERNYWYNAAIGNVINALTYTDEFDNLETIADIMTY